LVVFVHPKCPCSRATIRQLADALAKCSRPIEAQVVVYKPANTQPDWERTELWNIAVGIPGATIVIDVDGVEAKRFDVTTSGHSLLYDTKGLLLFSGGITSARGHEGENEGRNALVSCISNDEAQCSTTPVYGCPL